jgi:hypothetical protein
MGAGNAPSFEGAEPGRSEPQGVDRSIEPQSRQLEPFGAGPGLGAGCPS